jgi:hypothetical protein
MQPVIAHTNKLALASFAPPAIVVELLVVNHYVLADDGLRAAATYAASRSRVT